MKARLKRSFSLHGHAYDQYSVDDGESIHTVTVSVTGAMDVSSPTQIDSDHLVCILAAVLEQEEKRGFK